MALPLNHNRHISSGEYLGSFPFQFPSQFPFQLRAPILQTPGRRKTPYLYISARQSDSAAAAAAAAPVLTFLGGACCAGASTDVQASTNGTLTSHHITHIKSPRSGGGCGGRGMQEQRKPRKTSADDHFATPTICTARQIKMGRKRRGHRHYKQRGGKSIYKQYTVRDSSQSTRWESPAAPLRACEFLPGPNHEQSNNGVKFFFHLYLVVENARQNQSHT